MGFYAAYPLTNPHDVIVVAKFPSITVRLKIAPPKAAFLTKITTCIINIPAKMQIASAKNFRKSGDLMLPLCEEGLTMMITQKIFGNFDSENYIDSKT